MINKELFVMFFRKNFFISLIVSLGTGGITLFLTVIFPATDIQSAELISSTWPQIMKDLFGDPVLAFTSIYGWLYLQVFHITFWLVFSVLSSILSVRIIAFEIENKTIDILLSTPITRIQLIISRFVSLIIIIFISIIPTIIGCGIGIKISGYDLKWNVLIATSIIGFLLTISFASITLLISIVTPRQIFSIFMSLSLFGLMFLYKESLAKIIPFFEKLSFISLFHFYRPENILIHKSFSFYAPISLTVIAMFFLIISIFVFLKKDIFV